MTHVATIQKGEFSELDKNAIEAIASHYEDGINEGFIDPIEALIIAKKGQEIYKAVERRVRPLAESEISIPKGDKITKYYAEVTQGETGVKYDYASCGDKLWDNLNAQLESISAEIKEREKFLQGVKKEQGCFDPETGESWTVNPPVRTGKIGLKITIK
ncbi:MAG TPA: hypothetical protein VD907_06830 [Verrucomicrobiae bacterium]|nr:hypothetical protein [Verrucomicrobiae bacterium]